MTDNRPTKPWTLALVLLLCAAILVAATVSIMNWMRPRLSEERVSRTVMTTIQREARESFLVTGRLEIGTSTTGTSTSILLPELLDVEMGETVVRVRVPGSVAYGFDIREISADDIRYKEGSVVEVRLPELRVFSVEPRIGEAEFQTDVGGWQRFNRGPERRMTQRALAEVGPALRRQAEAHLASSEQPRLNTARTVSSMLAPALEAAGMNRPRFRFLLAEGDTLEIRENERRVIPFRTDGVE